MFLTISIPTFKRPELLRKNIFEILTQFSKCADSSKLCLFIADDSGILENKNVIAEARDAFPNASILHTSNEVNLGIDRNIVNCIVSPDSEYIWLLGEDDLLVPGAIDHVCRLLRKSTPCFLFANYIYCNDDHGRFSKAPVIQKGEFPEYCEFNSFLASKVWALGFIGSCVIRKDDWVAQKYSKFDGSYYSHVGGIVDLALNESICVVDDILVLNRAEDVNTFTWSSSTFDVYFSFYKVLAATKLSGQPELLSECVRSAAKLFSIYSLKWLAAKRADGVFNQTTFFNHYSASDKKSFIWKASAYIISVFPRAPLAVLRKIHLRRRFQSSSF